jgi:dephospho-CoA kinase
MKQIIGIVGENGAGKDTFTTFFKAAAAPAAVSSHRFSDVLYDTLHTWGIDASRANLQNLAIIMNKQFGEGSLTRATKSRIDSDDADVVIVEGIRWLTDVPMVRSFPKSYIVYVTAEPGIRFERMRVRGEKAGERDLTFERFEQEEKAKTELEIPKIGAAADFKIENNGPLDNFRNSVENLYLKLKSQTR